MIGTGVLALLVWVTLSLLGSRMSDRSERLLILTAERLNYQLVRVRHAAWVDGLKLVLSPVLGQAVQGAMVVLVWLACAVTLSNDRRALRWFCVAAATGWIATEYPMPHFAELRFRKAMLAWVDWSAQHDE